MEIDGPFCTRRYKKWHGNPPFQTIQKEDPPENFKWTSRNKNLGLGLRLSSTLTDRYESSSIMVSGVWLYVMIELELFFYHYLFGWLDVVIRGFPSQITSKFGMWLWARMGELLLKLLLIIFCQQFCKLWTRSSLFVWMQICVLVTTIDENDSKNTWKQTTSKKKYTVGIFSFIP